MWIVERLEGICWVVVASCTSEQDADTVLAALQLANPTDEFRKRQQTSS